MKSSIEEIECNPNFTDSIWICKPGENANRGKGIVVLQNITEVSKFLESGHKPGELWVVQRYI